MSRQKINRVIFYAAGLLILALGIILNTKAGLYTVFVVLEMFMHTIKNMYDRRHGDAVLAAALVCTGIGAAMSLNMRIVPNPGDGIVQAIADCIHQSVGNTKNGFDLCKGEDGSGSRG